MKLGVLAFTMLISAATPSFANEASDIYDKATKAFGKLEDKIKDTDEKRCAALKSNFEAYKACDLESFDRINQIFAARAEFDAEAEKMLASRDNAFKISGIGNESCGALVEHQRNNKAGQFGDWLGGYLSAAQRFGSAGEAAALHNFHYDSWMLWMEDYCIAHPTDDVDLAARHLVGFALQKSSGIQ